MSTNEIPSWVPSVEELFSIVMEFSPSREKRGLEPMEKIRALIAERAAQSGGARAEAAPRGTPGLGLEGLRTTVQSLLDACEPGTLRMHKLRHERFDNEPGYWLTEEYVEFLCARWQETHHDLAMSAAAPRAPEPEAGDNVQARTCPWCGKGPQVYGKTDVRCRDAKCPGHVHWRSIEAWNSCAPPRASEDGEVAKSPSVVYDAPRSATPGDGLDGSGVSQPPREADPRPALLSAQAFHAALMARYQAECEACSRCQGFGATAAATNHAVRAVTFLESANLVAAYEFDAGQLQPLTAAEFAEFPVQGRPPHDAPPSSAVKETGGLLPCEGGCTGKDSPSVDSWGDGAFSVSCWTCKRSTQKCATREEAIAAWNRRSPAPSDVSADEVEHCSKCGRAWTAKDGDNRCCWSEEKCALKLTHRSAAAKVPSVEECERAYNAAAYGRDAAGAHTHNPRAGIAAVRALFARDESGAGGGS